MTSARLLAAAAVATALTLTAGCSAQTDATTPPASPTSASAAETSAATPTPSATPSVAPSTATATSSATAEPTTTATSAAAPSSATSAAASSASAPAAATTPQQVQAGSYGAQLPAGWNPSPQLDGDDLVASSPDGAEGKFSVVTMDADGAGDAEAVAKQFSGGGQPIVARWQLAGEPAVVVSTGTDAKGARAYQAVALHAGKTYLISYASRPQASEADALAAFQQLLGSWTWR